MSRWGRYLKVLHGCVLLVVSAGPVLAEPPVPGSTNKMPFALLFPARSPVEAFRELLAMPRADRLQYLSSKSPETRKQISAKLREYESLKPEDRELRLKVTELRWYLLPLMHAPSTNRTAQLERIPEGQREMVASRIREWDALAPEIREELLRNEATLQYFTEVDAGNTSSISPARRQKLEEGIAKWKALPEERRRDIVLRFNKFFDLNNEEKHRAMSVLSDAERRQIDKTLKAYEKLPQQQRQQCIRSFQKFASLSLDERQEFLKNAERWKLMPPEERQSWRELVSRLSSQPPLPPGLVRPSPAELIRKRLQSPPLPYGATNKLPHNAAAQPPLPSASHSQGSEADRMISTPASKPAANANPVEE